MVEEIAINDDGGQASAKNIRYTYVRRVYLLVSTLFIFADHMTDIFLIVTLFQIGQLWFAAIYLAVDVFPAAIIMWNKYRTEKSWKVLVGSCNFFNTVPNMKRFHLL